MKRSKNSFKNNVSFNLFPIWKYPNCKKTATCFFFGGHKYLIALSLLWRKLVIWNISKIWAEINPYNVACENSLLQIFSISWLMNKQLILFKLYQELGVCLIFLFNCNKIPFAPFWDGIKLKEIFNESAILGYTQN